MDNSVQRLNRHTLTERAGRVALQTDLNDCGRFLQRIRTSDDGLAVTAYGGDITLLTDDAHARCDNVCDAVGRRLCCLADGAVLSMEVSHGEVFLHRIRRSWSIQRRK